AIDAIESVKKRPLLYILHERFSNCVAFIEGFKLAYRVFSGSYDYDKYLNVAIKEQGLASKYKSPWDLLVEKDLSDKEIIDILLTIEANTWKKLLETVGE